MIQVDSPIERLNSVDRSVEFSQSCVLRLFASGCSAATQRTLDKPASTLRRVAQSSLYTEGNRHFCASKTGGNRLGFGNSDAG